MLKQIINKYSDYVPDDMYTELIKINVRIRREVKVIEGILNKCCEGCDVAVAIQRHINKLKGEKDESKRP